MDFAFSVAVYATNIWRFPPLVFCFWNRPCRAREHSLVVSFADYVFGADWDVMSDVTKSRLYGFHDVVDSEAMFVRLLGRFREERIVP